MTYQNGTGSCRTNGGRYQYVSCRVAGKPSAIYLGGGLVQCSCATASVHAEPSGCSAIQVSASLPPSIR